MNWTDGCSFDYESGQDSALAYACRDQFPKISREGMNSECRRLRIDIYSLVKIDNARKLFAGDFGWYEVPFQGPPRRSRKRLPVDTSLRQAA